MSARYLTGQNAKTGDRISRQGEFGTVVAVGAELSRFGLDPDLHPNYAMIKYEKMGLVCEPVDTEDIELIRKEK
jgi:hypothetical protein